MERYIRNWITTYVMENFSDVYREPVIGFAKADDGRFLELKNVIDEKHLLPEDIIKGANTVIAYFLPYGKGISDSNTGTGSASELWAKSYITTNANIKSINEALEKELNKSEHKLGIIPATHNFDKQKLISFWSHRHVAEICGIGSFGLNNMLITEAGCSGRVGTVVTDLSIDFEEVPRKVERCLYKAKGSCRLCIAKCEVGALTIDGFDRKKCYTQCLINEEKNKELGQADVCGKCLVGLPCTNANPVL